MLSSGNIFIHEPKFSERWFGGTHLVSGTFFLDGSGLTVAKLIDDIGSLYHETRGQKRPIWPRGLAGYYIVPIYCSPTFSDDVLKRVRTRLPFRWAIWPEPLLYRTSDNTFASREDYGLHGSAFYSYLDQLFAEGLNWAANEFGYDIMPGKLKNP